MKTKGEQIVEMLCEGKSIKQITIALDISPSSLEVFLEKIRHSAMLPKDKRKYRLHKEEILSNVAKFNAYTLKIQEIKNDYFNTLTKFDS